MKAKPFFTVIISLMLGFSTVAMGCARRTEAQTITQNPADETSIPVVYEQIQETSRILIAYFSHQSLWDDVDNLTGASRVIVDGNMLGHVEHIANIIHRTTGGNLFTIRTVHDYPIPHSQLLEVARGQRDTNARPQLSTQITNLQNYDIIFLGFPNWWSDMPMPLYSFLERYNFAGKTIIPFSVHGGGRLPGALERIIQLQPGANVVTNMLYFHRNNLARAESDVTAWLNSFRLTL